MKKRSLLLTFAGALMPLCLVVACWMDVPLDKIVQESPVVVVGKITKIDVGKSSERAVDTAHIQVERVLKNGFPASIKSDGEVLLVMPGKSRQAHSSIDITYSLGQRGVWILESKDNGKTFAATYPKDFQPLSKEKEIAEIIAKKKK